MESSTNADAFTALSEASFAEDWNSPEDAIYDLRNGTKPRPVLAPVETLFLAGFVLGCAMWLAWARWLRLW